MTSGMQRKLTTVLAADAAGYSSAMDADEVGTLDQLRTARNVFEAEITNHQGRLVNTAGDGLLAEFPSVVEAVQCAIDVLRTLAEHEAETGPGLRFRIGVHLGDVMVENGDLFGEGVNLASRLQTMAEPGGILVSQQVYDQVRGKLTTAPEYLGLRRPKNFAEDVAVYRIATASQLETQAAAPCDARAQTETHADVEFDSVHMETAPQAIEVDEAGDAVPEREKQDRRMARIARRAGTYAVIGAGLLTVDIATGGPLWAHWPGLGMATALALEAVPAFIRGRANRFTAWAGVVAGLLATINLITWSGYPWALWPIGALATIECLRRIRHTT